MRAQRALGVLFTHCCGRPKGFPKATKVAHRLVHRYITRVIYILLVQRAIECVVSRSIPELEFFFLFQSLKKKKKFKCPGAGTSPNL